MSNHGYDAFVSAVRSECGKARDAVAAELRKQDLRVAVQSDLRHGPAGVSLLRTLHDTISDCADVHCRVGQRSGECPPPDTAAPFRDFLPETFAEASYTQWEYFFARRYVPDRTWLYLAAETYQPDEPAPTGPEHPELQLRFLDYLRRHGDGHLRFATIGNVRAEVLARRGQRSSAEAHGAGHQAAHEPLRRAVAANAIGSLIAGLLLLLLTSLAAQLGGGLDLLLLAPALLLSTLGAAAFFVLYHRYEAILSCRDADARAAYTALRHSLTEGGLAARVYAYRLRRALDAVDCFFGDADMADRTLLPHAFGLRTPAPLWTAAAFDRCLLLALIYPMATIVIFWAISGHVGPAEHALNLMPALPSWRRAIAVGAAALAALAFLRWFFASEREGLAWYGFGFGAANAFAGAGAFAFSGADTAADNLTFILLGAGIGTIDFAGIVVFAFFADFAGVIAISVAISVSVGLVFSFVFILNLAHLTAKIVGDMAVVALANVGHPTAFLPSLPYSVDTILFATGVAQTIVFSIVVDTAVTYLNKHAIRSKLQGRLQVLSWLTLVLSSLCAAGSGGGQAAWLLGGPLLLFLGLLTLINAPFDWAALGLMRAPLRRGLELGGWYPYALALADAMAAAGVIALLAIVSVLGVQAFGDLAAHAGGEATRLLPLGPLFDCIAANPSALEYWWIYAMLFSTMIPSLLNLMIGGASLPRGVPWLTTALLRVMPPHRAPRNFDRAWIACVLTAQILLGGLLGIAAQAALVYVVIGLLLPVFGLDLLGLARAVAAPDLPGHLLAWAIGPHTH